MKKCKQCNEKLYKKQNKFCNSACFQQHRYEYWIKCWLAGKETGRRGTIETSTIIKKYLCETRGNKCELCGWHEINKITKRVPIQLEHIDGNYRNNTPKNLKVLCPNCHSLTETFGNLNKGNGRKTRYKQADIA